jgi:nucleoid-associated protein YgaU
MSTVTASTRRLERASPRLSASARTPPATVRLTRRGQLVLAMLFVVVAMTVLALVGPRSAAVPGDAKLEPVRTVQVQPGQTLWDIARQVAPDQDPRAVVDAIVDLNALSDPGALQVGQRLGIPDFG